uniref:Protein FAR1-RELATED SEQUENCE n=1 Tax=Lactuca sativa TaxID=4236 RepID=A0A9R1UXI4_LACSA|nr:hypothetical protein LSAT_V11C800444930 [Lactuca sativa]
MNIISDDLFTNTDFRKRFPKHFWDSNRKPNVFEVDKTTSRYKRKYIKQVFSVHTRMLVEIKTEEKEINYSCELFKRMGLLCKHDFTIMMICGVKEITERDDKKKLALFVEKQKMLLKEFESESDYTSAGLKNKTDGEVECKLMCVSIPIPKEINIHVPQVQSNNAYGINKRSPSACEVAYENSKKEHRMCSGCVKRVPHNLRTCPQDPTP